MTERNQPEVDRAEISAMRRSYGEVGITESAINRDPIAQFQTWLQEAASNSMIVEANAMVLSTVGSGKPSSRTVLLKDVTRSGFTFYTNYGSRKSQEISQNSTVSLLFPWYPMERQVIVLGEAVRISAEESDKYFATRPWSSQIGAWASSQSEVLDSREALEARWKEFATKHPEGSSVPKPPHWGGFLVTPISIEFWQGRYSRLHDRLRFTKDESNAETNWKLERFFP
ncbi:MAG: pyridoxamine 5'-phosphate oxidase [Actinobacteria bacterium]|nr:pyridoxamine 5'-phosphate oxidase [Actinomycetota bacterium]